ncbi:MAG: hypothetical protein U0003_03185 [Vampirovibrionales bacterium]
MNCIVPFGLMMPINDGDPMLIQYQKSLTGSISPARACALFLITLSMVSAFNTPLWAVTLPRVGAKPTAQAWPMRDFLPPVATINPELPPEQASESATLGPENPLNELEVVNLAAVSTPVLTTRPTVTRLESRLNELDESTQALAALQQGIEEADLKALWDATVERNAVIRFSLEKLAAPDESLQAKQSSVFMRRTLNTMISGATLASMMLPGGSAIGSYRNMGIMAGSDALRNMANGTTKPQGQRLSATEKIQLAGLVDELQRDVVQNYHNYKRALSALTLASDKTVTAQSLYTKALEDRKADAANPTTALMLMTQGAAYYQARLYETRLQQEAEQHRLALERLAGTETVKTLSLVANPSALSLEKAPNTATTSLEAPQ